MSGWLKALADFVKGFWAYLSEPLEEPTFCAGCRTFSYGVYCDSRECNPPRVRR